MQTAQEIYNVIYFLFSTGLFWFISVPTTISIAYAVYHRTVVKPRNRNLQSTIVMQIEGIWEGGAWKFSMLLFCQYVVLFFFFFGSCLYFWKGNCQFFVNLFVASALLSLLWENLNA